MFFVKIYQLNWSYFDEWSLGYINGKVNNLVILNIQKYVKIQK